MEALDEDDMRLHQIMQMKYALLDLNIFSDTTMLISRYNEVLFAFESQLKKVQQKYKFWMMEREHKHQKEIDDLKTYYENLQKTNQIDYENLFHSLCIGLDGTNQYTKQQYVAAYKKMSVLIHPDQAKEIFPNKSIEESTQEMQKVNKAKGYLVDGIRDDESIDYKTEYHKLFAEKQKIFFDLAKVTKALRLDVSRKDANIFKLEEDLKHMGTQLKESKDASSARIIERDKKIKELSDELETVQVDLKNEPSAQIMERDARINELEDELRNVQAMLKNQDELCTQIQTKDARINELEDALRQAEQISSETRVNTAYDEQLLVDIQSKDVVIKELEALDQMLNDVLANVNRNQCIMHQLQSKVSEAEILRAEIESLRCGDGIKRKKQKNDVDLESDELNCSSMTTHRKKCRFVYRQLEEHEMHLTDYIKNTGITWENTRIRRPCALSGCKNNASVVCLKCTSLHDKSKRPCCFCVGQSKDCMRIHSEEAHSL